MHLVGFLCEYGSNLCPIPPCQVFVHEPFYKLPHYSHKLSHVYALLGMSYKYVHLNVYVRTLKNFEGDPRKESQADTR